MKNSRNYLKVVQIFKQSFGNLPIEKLKRLAKENYLMYEARIAVRELIEEKEKSVTVDI
ncbi:MAG: hypothetical protein NZ529_01880 [Cytophagaceae bacterium]|nr:hypothetical protein [Cytophagaceae bacterium]MDW8455517.1 hypothetical protein [Cytophagaceae bacterium]